MITLRAATREDLPILYEFEQGVISAERPFDPFLKEAPITYYDIEDLIESERSEIVVAEADGEVIGVGYAQIRDSKPYWKEPSFVYLGFMYVLPSFRGKGINRLIIDYLKEWSLLKGLRELRLDVYVENAAAIRAYEKVGFSSHMMEMRLSLDAE